MKKCVPLVPKEMTSAQKYKALTYLMFLKKKRYGLIKGCRCANSRKHHVYIGKEDTSSPTVSTEALFLSCTIDTTKERDVATVDIPSAFMQADMEGEVDMKMEALWMNYSQNLTQSHIANTCTQKKINRYCMHA